MKTLISIFFLLSTTLAFSQEEQADALVLVEVPKEEVKVNEAVKIEDERDLADHVQWAGIRGDFNYAGIVGLTAGTGVQYKRVNMILSTGMATAGNTVYGTIAKADLNILFPIKDVTTFYVSGKYYRMFVANQPDMNFVEAAVGAQSKNQYAEIGIRTYVGEMNPNYNLNRYIPSIRIGFKFGGK